MGSLSLGRTHLYPASDYFERLKPGRRPAPLPARAYVDDQSQARHARQPRTRRRRAATALRDRPVRKTRHLFRAWRRTKFPKARGCWRLKIEMASGNITGATP